MKHVLVVALLAACTSDPPTQPSTAAVARPPGCGDGVCSASEDAVSCPSDCWGLRGCFQDGSARTLPVYFGDGFTLESCRAAAASQGYQFVGLQYYGQCFAGNDLPPQILSDASCNTACTANPAESCGGAWANRVFSTGPWDHIHIDSPNVNQAVTDYPNIRFAPGDQVYVSANGCVQTGGSGSTWKRYVDPTGGNADRLYHGRIWIPGGTMGMVTVGSAMARPPVTVATPPDGANPADMYLRLGYDDDDYSDNGYWGHDDGTENQCANADGGNAYVDLWTYHTGGPGSTRICQGLDGYPMDPHWDAIDQNLLPLNPQWGEQCVTSDPTYMSIPFLCGPNGTYFDAFNRPAPACSSWWLTVDTKDAPWTPFGHLCSGDYGVNGHLNWGFATFTGRVYWQEYDNPTTGDGDYNLLLAVDNNASLTTSNGAVRDHTAYGVPNTPDVGHRALQLEFAGEETVFRASLLGTYPLSPGWNTFLQHSDADLARLIDGRPAVATGLVNLDMVHDPATELHPVLGLAIQTKSPARGDSEEAWMIMVRRSGDQGECSHSDVHYIHALANQDLRFVLPTSYAHPLVNGQTSLTTVGAVQSSYSFSPRGDGSVQLTVPLPASGDVALGELHLNACVPQCAGKCGGPDGCGDTCPAVACGTNQVCSGAGYCTCAAGTSPCASLGGQCAASCPSVCGDGSCNGGETCSSCPSDCGTCGPVCGDGLCSGGETCSSCPGDCGSCGPVCRGTSSDCCGDGICRSPKACASACP